MFTTLADFFADPRFSHLKLSSGAHTPSDPTAPGCKVCLQEAEALRRYLETAGTELPAGWWRSAWTDTPATCWVDLRGLNDAPWVSNEARTAALVPLEDRLRGVAAEKQPAVLRGAADHAVRVLVPMALRAAAQVHPQETHRATLEAAAVRCETEGTARAADAAAAVAAAADATAATDANADATDAVLLEAVRGWHAAIDAATA